MNTKQGEVLQFETADFMQEPHHAPRKRGFLRWMRRKYDMWRLMRDFKQTEKEYRAGKCCEFTTLEEVLKMDI